MPSIGLSFFILGLAVASVTADEVRANNMSTSAPGVSAHPISGNDSSPTTVVPPVNSNINSNPSVSNDTGSVNDTNTDNTNSTDTPSTTKGSATSTDDQAPQTTTPKMVTAKPEPTEIITTPTATKDKDKTTPAPQKKASDSTGIIILIVIILVAFVVGLVCFFAKKRGRRYSVDFTSRPDEANIPLSTIDPEVPADSTPQNGLQTFASAETAAEEPKEPEEPAEKPEVKEEPKAEADKSAVDPSAESAALPPPPPPDSSDDKPKEDVAEESLPPPPAPAPVEPAVEEKTDDEGAVSNKTSAESLKETNENNSNNSDFSQQEDTKSDSLFWDVPLNSPL